MAPRPSSTGWCRRRSRRRLAPREALMTSIDDPAALEVEDLAPHLDLFDPYHSERLWEVLSYARTACPVLKTDADEGYYVITRYDDLRTVLEDPETYSSVQAGLRGVPLPMPPLTEDPPRHIEYRRALKQVPVPVLPQPVRGRRPRNGP